MKNPFEYSFDNKRYHTLNYYYKTRYGKKLYKAVIDCSMTCPNIDGRCGYGGCIFCDGGSGYFTQKNISVTKQLELEYKRISVKNGDVPIVAYFQANTNTYAPVENLREIYNEALHFPHTAGLSIATRADCLPDDVIDLLCDVNKKTELTVELGMQTVHENTINYINRGYTHKDFLKGYYKLKEKNIRVCLHIINGLPDETEEMMIETARHCALLHPDGVKLQMLHIINGTALAEIYEKSHFPLLSREEYIHIITQQLAVLPPETVIERITGDGDKSKLIAPLWTMNKIAVLGGIDKTLCENDLWQGKYYSRYERKHNYE
ncbi:MAG: TIGR01212 family radical SAM protein [Ruminococcus sp.]|nr:TIGR01212 family radical SAM protein [Ruminococcus sp.]